VGGGFIPAQSSINSASTIAGTALDQPAGLGGSYIRSAVNSPNAVGSLTQTQAPVTHGGFSGNAGLPVPDASTAGINAARTSGIGSQFPSNTYGGSNIGNLPTPKVGDVGSQQYLFGKTLPGSIGTGALLGLANAFAPGVLSTAASLPGQSAQLGLQAANTGLGYARLGEQSRQFDAAEAGRDRRLGLQESGRDRRLGVTEQGRSDRAADTLALGRDNLALDQQGLEERRRQFDVGEQGRNTRQQTGINASRLLAEFSEQGRNNRLNLTEQGRNERANPFYGLGVGPGNTLSEIGIPTPEGGLLGPQNTAAQAAIAQRLYGNQGLRPAKPVAQPQPPAISVDAVNKGLATPDEFRSRAGLTGNRAAVVDVKNRMLQASSIADKQAILEEAHSNDQITKDEYLSLLREYGLDTNVSPY